jgi:hypothetical protein
MPGKSKHSKGKRYQQIKKPQTIQRQDAAAATVSTPSAGPVAAPVAQKVQAVKSSGTAAAVKADQYDYIPGDLRRIGILTGIIAVILIVLYFIMA